MSNWNKKNFIENNIDLLNKYEIEDIYQKVLQRKFYEDYKIHIQVEMGELKIKDLGFSVDKNIDYEVLVDEFETFLKYHEIDLEEARALVRYEFLSKTYFGKEKNPKVRFGWSHFLNSFIDLIVYLKNDEMEKDLAYANKILDKHRTTRDDSFEVEIPELNMTVKKFKNGKYQFKGLDSEIWEKIFELKEKIENIRKG